jgi:hypothetical protein
VPGSRDLVHICGGSHRTEEETERNSLNYCLEREGSLVSGHNFPYLSGNKNISVQTEELEAAHGTVSDARGNEKSS